MLLKSLLKLFVTKVLLKLNAAKCFPLKTFAKIFQKILVTNVFI